MQVLAIAALLLGLAVGVALLLLIQDIEVQRKMFRRYVKQVDEHGRILSEVKWGSMKHGFFIRSGWLYRMPSIEDRPDLAYYPELVDIREKIQQNWRMVPWLLAVLMLCGVILWLSA
jgi:hypothetical protein